MSNNDLSTLDIEFLRKCSTPKIIELFKNGYEEFIINNIKLLSKPQISRLLSKKDEQIDYIKDKILTKDIALLYTDDILFFTSLPNNKRNLIAYYGYNCYEMEIFGYNKTQYDSTLRKLLKETFPEFNNELQEQILSFYGNLSSRTIDFVLKKLTNDINYLTNVKEVATKYFNNNLKQTIMFHEKYPNLYKKISSQNIKITSEIKELLIKLSENSVLEKIDDLEIENLYNLETENYNYATDKVVTSSKIYKGCMDNYNINTILFNYPREIIKIDIDSNIEEYDADISHLITLKSIYKDLNTSNMEILEIIYNANLKGDTLFITENAGLIIWLPPTTTTNQKEKILNLLSSIPNTEDICISYAITDKSVEFVMLKEGKYFNKEQAIIEIKKIKVDDNCNYLKLNNNKRK